ncbi:hypothetical protein F5Y14DRAFT_394611 [Nemania sp. NC0429]|nr:hypothetical protein F5Y14DRAFT_394611 [Nemania sp. NC0429]
MLSTGSVVPPSTGITSASGQSSPSSASIGASSMAPSTLFSWDTTCSETTITQSGTTTVLTYSSLLPTSIDTTCSETTLTLTESGTTTVVTLSSTPTLTPTPSLTPPLTGSPTPSQTPSLTPSLTPSPTSIDTTCSSTTLVVTEFGTETTPTISQAQTGVVPPVNSTVLSATGSPSTFVTSTTTPFSSQSLNTTRSGLASTLGSVPVPGSGSSTPLITGLVTARDDQTLQDNLMPSDSIVKNHGRRDLGDESTKGSDVVSGAAPGLRNWQRFARHLVAGVDW